MGGKQWSQTYTLAELTYDDQFGLNIQFCMTYKVDQQLHTFSVFFCQIYIQIFHK